MSLVKIWSLPSAGDDAFGAALRGCGAGALALGALPAFLPTASAQSPPLLTTSPADGKITGPPGLLDALVFADDFDQEEVPASTTNQSAGGGSRQLEHFCELGKTPQAVRAVAYKGPGYGADYATCIQFVQGPCAVGNAVCSTDGSIELECDVMGFVIEGGQLVHRSLVLAYTTPADSTAFGLAMVSRPIECYADVLHETGTEDITTAVGPELNTTRLQAQIPVVDTYWCQPAGDDDFYTGATCASVLPQDSVRPLPAAALCAEHDGR
eukprot:COSAG04_NODE_4143_length_2273_cov_1.343146_1_plen_268_part_00